MDAFSMDLGLGGEFEGVKIVKFDGVESGSDVEDGARCAIDAAAVWKSNRSAVESICTVSRASWKAICTKFGVIWLRFR